MPYQSCYDIKKKKKKKPSKKKTPRESSQERENASLKLPEKGNSDSVHAETIPQTPASPLFQGATLPRKPRPAFAEAGSLEKGASLLHSAARWDPSGLQTCPGLQTLPSQTSTKAGGRPASTRSLTHVHILTTQHTHTYIPFTLHCARPSGGGSC